MNITAKFKDAFSRVRSNLTSLDRQPLSKAALVIILFLDIFILTAIFNGLDEHTRQLSSPDDRIPYTCREIVINNRWNATNRIDNLSQIVVAHSTRFYPVEEKRKELHPVCAPYLDLVDQIKNDKTLTLALRGPRQICPGSPGSSKGDRQPERRLRHLSARDHRPTKARAGACADLAEGYPAEEQTRLIHCRARSLPWTRGSTAMKRSNCSGNGSRAFRKGTGIP